MDALRSALATISLVPLAAALSCVGDEALAPVCAATPCPFTGALTAPVEIVRDASGMVHVYAASDDDAFLASGYMQAHDRLFQMELMRRRALGRSSEIFGDGRKDEDVLLRVLDIPRWGRENAALTAELHPEIHRLAEAWTAGVNRFVGEVRSGERPLPPGFAELGVALEDWEASDGYAIGKLLLFGNANQIEFDVLSTALVQLRPQALERIPLLAPLHDAFATPIDSPALDPDVWSRVPRRGPRPDPEVPPDAAERLARFSAAMELLRPGASNNWAVDASRSATGRPLLAGDPHQGLSSPNVFWAHHLNSADAGGTFDVVGWSFVGTPSVQLGHNRKVAWTATTNYPDTMDLIDVIRVDDATVQIAGETIALVVREETIAIRDQEPHQLQVLEVPGRGVLLPPDFLPLPIVDPGHDVLLAWTGLRPTREAYAFFQFDRAGTLDAFDAAVDAMEIGCFNFVAASAEGITYRSSPEVPDRGDPATRPPAYLLLDGADPAASWTGAMLPPEKMPHARGSASGWLATANADPFGFTRDAAIAGDPWYFGVYYDPGVRQARIAELLQQRIGAVGALTLDDMKAIQTDVRSLLADEVVAHLERAWTAPVEGDEAAAEAAAIRARTDVARVAELLRGWDREMTREQGAPVAFSALAYFLTRQAVSDDLGIFFGPIGDAQPIYLLKFGLLGLRHPERGAVADGVPLTVLRALAETTDWILARWGSVDALPTWGEVHGARFASVGGPSLDGGFVSTPGGDGTVNVASARFFGEGHGEDGRFESRGGAAYRMVATIDEDGVPRAEFAMPRGLVGDPASPHWQDLEEDWVEGRYRPLLFRRDEVDAAATERWTLEP